MRRPSHQPPTFHAFPLGACCTMRETGAGFGGRLHRVHEIQHYGWGRAGTHTHTEQCEILFARIEEGTIMAPNTKRVLYVKYLPSTVYSTLLAKRPDVQLDKLENDSPDDQIASVLTQAHVYQIGASRQIISPAASSNGAGYDTIDVDACTEAGIAVVNQSDGNKEAVAEHALAMMLTLSKRIVEADRHARTGQTIDRGTYIGRELNERTVGVLGIGNAGGRLAAMCRAPSTCGCSPMILF
jgi:hypothetical protein